MTDNRKQQKLNAAHHDALGEGLTPNTDDYFKHVEKFLGMTKQEDAPARKEEKPLVRKESPVVAPGDAVSNGRSAPRTVTLTPNEAKSATDGTLVWNYDDPSGQKKFKKGDPIGVQEFARRKATLITSGRYDRVYTEG